MLSDACGNDIVQDMPSSFAQSVVPDTSVETLFLTDPTIPEALGCTDNLLGRDSLFRQVKQRLLQGGSLALTAFNGLPGIGKTALAVALAIDEQMQAHFCHGILWAGLGPHPNVLGQLARWGKLLGVVLSEVEDINSLEAWARALQAKIGHRRMLLVIDDAWSAEHALALRVGGMNCAHLLTTRQPQVAFAFAHEGSIVVHELEEADGLALLARFVPKLVHQDPDRAQALVRAVGCLPLALTLIGKYLAAQSFTGQPRRLLAALNQLDTTKRLYVNMSIPLRLRSPSLPSNMPLSLHTTITISVQQLSSQARTTLYALSVFPPKPNTFSEEAALAISQERVETLDILWDVGLLASCGSGRYTLHQTIVDYARLQVEDTEVPQRLVNYVLTYVQSHEHDYNALECEMNNIVAALDIASAQHMEKALIQIVGAMISFMNVRGLYTQADHYLQLALKAARALEDHVAGMATLYHLATFAELRGEYSEAEAYSQEGLAMAQQLGQIDMESILFTVLGQVVFRCGYYVRATAFYEQGLLLARQLGNIELSSLLLSYLGNVNRYQGNYTQAVGLYQEGLILAQQNGYQELTCRLLAYLGGVMREQGNYRQAEQYCIEGHSLAHHLGHRENLTMLLNNLGAIAYYRGNYKQAEVYEQDGLILARQIGYRSQICRILANLGGIASEQGNYAQAEQYLQEGIILARQLGNRDNLAHLLINLGATIGRQGDYHQANACLQESAELARNLRDPRLISGALVNWGELHVSYQRLEAATVVFDEVLTLNSQSDRDPDLLAHAKYGLAQIAALGGDITEAHRLCQESLTILESLGHHKAEEVKLWLCLLSGKELPIELKSLNSLKHKLGSYFVR
ncbi:MAG TPA: tetratricopeptide repeat protein [Ktedonobacteraceae bacterium]|jgi:tetratricopeptide (TPR) repeat protein